MKLLHEITEATLGIGEAERLDGMYQLRKSARVLLRNEVGDVAVQYLQNYAFHKLPGGGIDAGETVVEALFREVKEEVGCACVIDYPIGVVIEYRHQNPLLQISYCYAATVTGAVGMPQLEEGEVEEGQVTLWMSPQLLAEKLRTDIPKKYEGHFILQRERSFVEEYLKTIL